MSKMRMPNETSDNVVAGAASGTFGAVPVVRCPASAWIGNTRLIWRTRVMQACHRSAAQTKIRKHGMSQFVREHFEIIS